MSAIIEDLEAELGALLHSAQTESAEKRRQVGMALMNTITDKAIADVNTRRDSFEEAYEKEKEALERARVEKEKELGDLREQLATLERKQNAAQEGLDGEVVRITDKVIAAIWFLDEHTEDGEAGDV